MESNQKARDNAIQLQANTINIGITEKEARELMLNEGKRILEESKLIASDTAFKRINYYINTLIPKMIKYEVMNAFSEPSIQVLLNSTEKKAMCTDRESDYEMLSELLINRIKKADDYVIKAATNKTIEIIDNISEEALLGITLLFAIYNLTPEAGRLDIGIKILDSLYEKLINEDDMPVNQYWIDNLELVQAIRIIPFSTASKYQDILFNTLNGYFVDGLKKDSEVYKEAVKKIEKAQLPLDILYNNPYWDGYYILAIPNENSIENVKINRMTFNGKTLALNINEIQIITLKEIFKSYERNQNNINIIRNKFKEKIKEYPNIEKVSAWWNNNISGKINIQLTAVGNLLAQINANRLDNRVPKIEH